MYLLDNLHRITYDHKQIKKLLKVYECLGKKNYYTHCFRTNLKAIQANVVEEDSIYLAKIMNLEVSEFRQKMIIENNSNPKNNDETILYNIKEIIKTITKKGDKFKLSTNELLQLNNMIHHGIIEPKYVYTTIKNTDTLVSARKESKRKDVDKLVQLYTSLVKNDEFEGTLIISNFYIDLINLKAFTEGNKITALITLCVMLYEHGFDFFKYVSFFKLLYNQLNEFNNTVNLASYNWESGFSKIKPLNDLILDIILEAYQRMNKMILENQIDTQIRKTIFIENTIMKLPEVFTKEQIRVHRPLVSDSTIDRTLKRLREEGKIRPNNVGRSATWLRIIDTDNRLLERHNNVTHKQLRLEDIIGTEE